jgi:predicted PurR-regulated permease PerM
MKSFVDSLSGALGNVFVIIVYVIFFLMEENKHLLKIQKLFPGQGKGYQKFVLNQRRINKAVGSYLWSKTLISLFTGGASYIILLIMNVEYAFLWSFLIFVFNFIPYIGPLISSLLPAIFAALSKADLMQFIWVFAAMEGVQIILGNFIEPMIMGKGSNLGPVSVVVALAFWGLLWDLTGMVMAIPITSVFVIVCSQIPSARFIAIILSERGDIEPLEQI